MIRICHLADIHLGYRKYSKVTKLGVNQREVDISVAFREAIDKVIALKPTLTVIAGDLFHTVRPSNAIVTFAFRELKKLTTATNAPVVIIAGNHETPKRADSGCILKLFSEIAGVYVADTKAEKIVFKDKDIALFAVPHAALASIEQNRPKADDAHAYNILVAHGQISERWISDFGGVELPLQALSPNEWDYIALGHVHVPREVSHNCWYSGSVEHTANNIWAERSEGKGFLEVTLEKGATHPKVTFHTLKSPRLVEVLPTIDGSGKSAAELTEEIIATLSGISGGIEGKIVRLEIDSVPREVVRQLYHKALKKFRLQALYLALEFRQPQLISSGPLTPTKRVRLQDALHTFCAEQIVDDTKRREQLQNLFLDYFKKLESNDETASTAS